jgi:enterobacteria phage integrase
MTANKPARTTTVGMTSMPRRLPPFVERNHVKGHTYLSFRRGKGPRLRLPNDPTSDEFIAAYQSALLGQTTITRNHPTTAQPGTIAALIASYLKSANYVGLRQTSKVGYLTRLETLRVEHGHRTVVGLNRSRIITAFLQPFADRPGAALDTLKKLRILIRHAIDLGWLKYDPSIGIKRPKIQKIRSWTQDEIAAFRKKWPLGSKQRLAFEMFLNSGQRRSDVVRMAWSHLTADNQKIAVVQQKTGRRLLIPLHRDLLAALAAARRDHVSIITTAYNRPFTVDGFSQWLRNAIAEAGLPLDCQPHGLRKATGRRLAEVGATTKEIMSILGHTTLAEAERYTEEADQIGLAEGAVIKLEARTANKPPQTASDRLGKNAKSEKKSR